MLSREDNELMCRVEPGFPMHEAFKRYWLVAGLSEDHPAPDSDPKRTTLLGEDYVLFRDSQGRIGCLRELCCHRGASLCLGRVEDGGIRCIYHGWKFDADGAILDMPNAADQRFKERYRQPAFPVREIGGLIWVYLGPAGEQPPPPDYYWLHLPADRVWIAPTVFEANYTQVIDGGADSSHLTILHQNALRRQLMDTDGRVRDRILADAAPTFDRAPTEFGQFSVAIRKVPAPDGALVKVARCSAFVAPSTVMVTGGDRRRGTWGVAVPVNSHRTIFYIGVFDLDLALDTESKRNEARAFQGLDPENMAHLGISRETCDRPDKFGRANNWMQDRASMRSGASFTGLSLFIPEDIAVSESMGSIFDRSTENLVPADVPIVGIRRILLEMVRDVQAGRKPIGLRSPVDTSKIVCREAQLDDGQSWTELLVPEDFRAEPVS